MYLYIHIIGIIVYSIGMLLLGANLYAMFKEWKEEANMRKITIVYENNGIRMYSHTKTQGKRLVYSDFNSQVIPKYMESRLNNTKVEIIEK